MDSANDFLVQIQQTDRNAFINRVKETKSNGVFCKILPRTPLQ